MDGVRHSVSDRVAAGRAKLTTVLSYRLDSFELDTKSITKLRLVAERGSRVYAANIETSGMPCFMSLIPGID